MGRLWRALALSTLVLVVCDVIGGFLAVAAGVVSWSAAWGFDAQYTVPLPIGAVQVALAWLAARNVRPPVGLIAAGMLCALCLISLIFGRPRPCPDRVMAPGLVGALA